MSDSAGVERDRHDAGAHVPEDPDLEAVRAVLAGDVEAFATIVTRWQGRLLNLAWRFCRDRAMAEDMVQEAFIKAFRSLRTFRHEAAFSTWLTAIAINSYRSFLRNRPAPAAILDVAADESMDTVSRLVAEEQASAIRRLVQTLPWRYQAPMVLFYFQEMNLANTAAVLGLPEGTLKARLHRGRELLKRRLSGLSLEPQVPRGRD